MSGTVVWLKGYSQGGHGSKWGSYSISIIILLNGHNVPSTCFINIYAFACLQASAAVGFGQRSVFFQQATVTTGMHN